MPQHDLDVANGSGAVVRADINGALVALGSTMKGPNAPPAPIAGMMWVEDDSPSATVWTLRVYDGADWITIGTIDSVNNQFAPTLPSQGLRNLVINGNPTINQRNYVSGTAVGAANTYTLDRWRVVTSGQSLSWTDSAGVRTVTFPAGGGEQVIEGSSIAAGTYTLSWTGTATAQVNGSGVTNGGQVTLAGGTDATIRMINGTASLIQLERGAVATTFERRPIGVELMLCQRYFQTLGHAVVPRFNALAGQSFIMPIRFPVVMRAAPTATPSFSGSTNIVANVINRITAAGCSAEVTANVAGDAFVTLDAVTTFASEF